MAFLIEDIQTNVYNDGTPSDDGEFNIIGLFNMTPIAKVYSRKMAQTIMDLLYLQFDPDCKNGNLVEICQFIRNCIKEWLNKYPEEKNNGYDDAVSFIIGKVMQKTKGTLNPDIVKDLILMERKAWDKDEFMRELLNY